MGKPETNDYACFCLGYRARRYLDAADALLMLEVLKQDYVRTAQAKGLMRRIVVLRHAFRNALIPVITILGLQLGDCSPARC